MNTIDFKIKGREYVNTPPLQEALNLLDKEDLESHFVVAFARGAEYALENQWISVKDELPKIGDDGYSDNIFIHGSGGYVGSAYFEDNKFYSWIGDDEIIGVDYWMPIPELNFGDK